MHIDIRIVVMERGEGFEEISDILDDSTHIEEPDWLAELYL